MTRSLCDALIAHRNVHALELRILCGDQHALYLAAQRFTDSRGDLVCVRPSSRYWPCRAATGFQAYIVSAHLVQLASTA